MTKNSELADEIERLSDKATPRPWKRTPAAERDEDYLTGPDSEELRRIDAKLMQTLANNLPDIIAALRAPQKDGAAAMNDANPNRAPANSSKADI